MSCTCGSEQKFEKRLKILQKKYDTLRKNHKRLVGVTVELTEALEEFVKSDKKPNINNRLFACSNIYPGLFEKDGVDKEEKEAKEKPLEIKEIKETAPETTSESEKEYLEGFWSRPRIPRTPLIN